MSVLKMDGIYPALTYEHLSDYKTFMWKALYPEWINYGSYMGKLYLSPVCHTGRPVKEIFSRETNSF